MGIFTKDSETLIDYLKTKKKSIETNELVELYSFLDDYPIKEIIEYSINEEELFNETIIKSSFASDKVIKSGRKLKKKLSISFNNGSINVNLNIYHKSNKNLNEMIKKIVAYIQYIISFTELKKEINIDIYLNNLKKISNSPIPTKDNVNSGSCLNNDNTSHIIIWRGEELLKVLVHELIHALCYDKYSDNMEIIEHYKKTYNVSSNIMNTGEAYTEIWANIVNCYLITKIYHMGEESFYHFLSLEKAFCLFQAHKIFHLTGLGKKQLDINKYTNILSYYIIRMELYNNIDGFIYFCRNHNKNYIEITNSQFYLNFLKKNSENNKVKSKNSRFSNLKNNDFVYKTLRMTSIELKV
jgi:hypothetical protein